MNFNFTIETTAGEKSSIVNPSIAFTNDMPFGFVSYGDKGTSSAAQADLDRFWTAIDAVLTANGLTSANFIRAINAVKVSDGNLVGEL